MVMEYCNEIFNLHIEDNVMTILGKRNLKQEKYGDLTKNHAKCSGIREKWEWVVLKHPIHVYGKIFDDSQTAN